MRLRGMSSTARTLTVVALLVAATGFVVQMIAGVTDTPTVPPGLVVILAAAGLIAFAPGRWMPLAGPVTGLFSFVALFAVDADDRLDDLDPVSAFLGQWFMVAALVVASVSGAIATVRSRQSTS
jgi:hypothetical protein